MLPLGARALDEIRGRAQTASPTEWLSAEVRRIKRTRRKRLHTRWQNASSIVPAQRGLPQKRGPRRARGPGPAGNRLECSPTPGRPPAARASLGSGARLGAQSLGERLSARSPCSSSRSTTPSCPGTIRPPSCCTRRRSRRVPTRGRRSPSACSRSTTPSSTPTRPCPRGCRRTRSRTMWRPAHGPRRKPSSPPTSPPPFRRCSRRVTARPRASTQPRHSLDPPRRSTTFSFQPTSHLANSSTQPYSQSSGGAWPHSLPLVDDNMTSSSYPTSPPPSRLCSHSRHNLGPRYRNTTFSSQPTNQFAS
mmetsp:Transcript_27769/g.74043  ORF Transcript_27769/g.74043 Transcript_27769/m.74043 type:complete len:306 (+) Transcript_27769:284-1201(+)